MRADSEIRQAMRKWNDPNVIVTSKLKGKLAGVTAQLNKTLESLTARGEKLNTLLEASDDLAKSAKKVEGAGREVYHAMLWRVWKWYLLYFLAFCILLAIIIGAICGSGNC